MKPVLLASALALACCAHPAVADEWMVEAHYPDQAALIRAAALFQHVIVDPERQVLRVDTDDDGIRQLEDAGLTVSIDAGDTARLRAFHARIEDAIQSRQLQETEDGYPSIPGYACYRTVEGTYQTMDDLAATQPTLAEVHSIGPSWEKTRDITTGYEMRALRVTNRATAASDPDRPKMVMFGSIHAREYTPAELLTRMAEWLVNGYGTDSQATWLVDHVDFRFILQANPDGRKKAEGGTSWRKNTNTIDGTCGGTPNGSSQPGIDLNRNFAFHWNTTGGQGSSGTKCNLTYRGPGAASEPETRNLIGYVAGTPGAGGIYAGGVLPDRRPDAVNVAAPDDYAGLFFDIHSYSQLVLWPWGDTTNAAPNKIPLQTFGRRMAWFNGYRPEQSDSLYPTDGATDDNFYGTLGAPSYTIELGTNFFESCASFTNTTLPKNLAALKYAARAAAAPYKLPVGPDAYSVTASAPTQGAGGLYVTVNATIDDVRYSTANGTQQPYAIQGANAYVDRLPWDPMATPIALSAADGTFSATTETVRGQIDLNGLAPGRHLVFVQGRNTLNGGTPGTPDAVFIDVPPPTGTITATPIAVGSGSIAPPAPQTVASGSTLQFTLTPATGHHVEGITGCPGSFALPVYTTAALTANCSLTATFAPDQHGIGGSINGLTSSGLALRLDGGADYPIAANASTFAFPGTRPWGSTYAVTIAIQPDGLACTIHNGEGTISADVTDIHVDCEPEIDDTIFEDGFETR